MLEKLIASQQILTFEEWYKIMESFYILGFCTDARADYEEYVAEALAKW